MVNDRRIHSAFHITATVEAITWAGLLIGMILKRVLDVTELGVQVFGPLHGVAFIAYSITAIATWRVQRWSAGTGSLALLASLPPFGTVVFHRWAEQTGRLVRTEAGRPESEPAELPIA
jgi:integral membrane protein